MLHYWKGELDQYEDREILEALQLYCGEFFPSVKAIKDIMERRREARSEEAKRGQWDRWKRDDAEGKRATPEEIKQMVEACNNSYKRLESEGRLVKAGSNETRSAKDVSPQ